MFTTLRNAWKIPELRKKILFTLVVLLIYRLGNCVPVPYVNVTALTTYFSTQLSNTVLGLYNAMSGSAFSQATVFALGIQPYINASIIIELLCIAIPALERLAKDGGEEGKKKIQKITRYTTVGLGLLGQPDGILSIIGTRARNHRHTACGLLDRIADAGGMLLIGQRRGLAGGTADDDGIGAMGDLVINDAAQFFKVYTAISVHRGDNGNRSAGKNRLLHREYSFF